MDPEKRLRLSIHAAGLGLLCLLALLSWGLRKHWDRPRLRPEEVAALGAYARADSLRADSLARARSRKPAEDKPAKYGPVKDKPAKDRPVEAGSAPGKSSANTKSTKNIRPETGPQRQMSAKKDTVEAAERARWEAFKPLDTTRVELNTADRAQLENLRGIAGYYAQKILDYRQKLGGFVQIEQLLEIPGIDAQRFALFYKKVWVDTAWVKKLDLSQASEEVLSAHPYIGKYGARNILRWRAFNGGQCTVQDLEDQALLEPGRAQKLRPYCE